MRPYRYEAEGPVWCDGELLPASQLPVTLTDPALQSALGVFETLAVRGGVALDVPEHLDRLARAAARLSVALTPREALAEGLRAVSAAVEGGYGWIKILALRGRSPVIFAGRMDPNEEGADVTAVLLPYQQSLADPLAGFKTINYAGRLVGLEEARRRGADEGIWLNTRGHLAEGCTSNLFVVSGRKIFTPSLADGILPGVVRGIALRAAQRLGIVIHEGKTRLERLERADEAFVTSSLRAVRALVRFEGRPVGRGEAGPITRRLATEVQRIRLGLH